ncbi:MAG: hypothetical protein ACLTC7_04460 [Eubacterium sp.]
MRTVIAFCYKDCDIVITDFISVILQNNLNRFSGITISQNFDPKQ